MADERIEDISGGELTAIAPDDKFVILDTSDTTDDAQGTTKYVQAGTLGLLATGATKTASFTAVKGELYPISIASLAANIDVTFPAAPAAGDTFGIYVAIQNTTDTAASGFALAPFWGVEPLATTSINGTSYTQAAGDGLGKWGLMLNGEVLVFRWDAVGSTWVVAQDGRIPQVLNMYRSTAQSISDNTATLIQVDLTTVDTWGMIDTTAFKAQIKRGGNFDSYLQYNSQSSVMDDGEFTRVQDRTDASTNRRSYTTYSSGTSRTALAIASYPIAYAAANDVFIYVVHTQGAAMDTATTEASRVTFATTERL